MKKYDYKEICEKIDKIIKDDLKEHTDQYMNWKYNKQVFSAEKDTIRRTAAIIKDRFILY